MLAGSTAPDPPVANSYASASTEDEGLTGMVLRLIKKKPGEDRPERTEPRLRQGAWPLISMCSVPRRRE